MASIPLRWLVVTVLAVTCLSAAASADEPLSLAGMWRFRRDDKNAGLAENWAARRLAPAPAGGPQGPGEIHLPGTTDQARAGDPNLKKPTLDGLYRPNVYTGAAWYERDVEVPAAWQDHRLTLFLERVRWVSQAWLDGQPLGQPQDSLIAPHVYELPAGVSPGKHRLTLRVDNTPKINLGVFVSALYGGTPTDMNGIVGRIELQPHDKAWIQSQQVYANNDGTVRVETVVRNECSDPVAGRISAAVVEQATGEIVAQGSRPFEYPRGITHDGRSLLSPRVQETMTLKFVRPPKLWSEFTPHLYTLQTKVQLGQAPRPSDTRDTAFGFREIGTRGTQLTMNGRPIFIRGTLECAVFPVTGYPPTDVTWWQRVCRIIKSYGLNALRFHSWCPPDAAFAAADAEGVMIQAEGPQANVPAGQDPVRDAFVEQELLRMVRTYGNHPSFCLMTLGNEYAGRDEVLTHWVDMLIKEDPRRLYSSPSSNGHPTANCQFTVAAARGIQGPGTEGDHRQRIGKQDRPLISHEVGQWMFFPNFAEMRKYTGVLEPRNFEIIRDDLQAKGLLDLAPRYYETWGRQAVMLYKEEIEILLRTPGHTGFELLDLHDYPSQGTALVGPLDPFWDSKGFVAPEEHSHYCGPTVPLLRMPKRTYAADELFTASAEVAHFGPADLKSVQPEWSLHDEQGRELAAGRLPSLTVPTGRLTELGSFKTPLKRGGPPCKLTVQLALADTAFVNQWDIWVYPAGPAPDAPADVTVCRHWDAEAKAALAAGKKVLLQPEERLQNVLPGKFLPVFWSPVWFPRQKPNTMGVLCDPLHPAFAEFPTEAFSNWQWWDLMEGSQTLILTDTPATFRPVVQIMDNFARNWKLGSLLEARVGPGRLMLSTLDLSSHLDTRLAARQMLRSVLSYMKSERFQPAQELSLATLDNLLVPHVYRSTLERMGARVIEVDSEDRAHDNTAAHAIDGDPASFWHTRWGAKNDPLPHHLAIDLGRETTLSGVNYLPRQDMATGRIARAEIYCSLKRGTWGQPVARVDWPNSDDQQTVRFPVPVRARYLKLVARSEVHGQPFTAVAELDVLPAAESGTSAAAGGSSNAALAAAPRAARANPKSEILNLKSAAVGHLPAGWSTAHTGEGTGSVWQVVEDATAPGGAGRALKQVSATGQHRFFNLCVADATGFTNLELRVSFKAVAGKEDQGGGLVWRYQNADNYYIARMNPLEHNFRVYKVVAGKRIQLQSVDVYVETGTWHTMRIMAQGERVQCFLDDHPYLDARDATFPGPGKIGLWTKADAQTEFAALEMGGI